MDSIRDKVFAYVKTSYQVEPDYPFDMPPDDPVLRHPDTRKWFGILMNVPRSRLGLEGEEWVDILNLKCSPGMASSLRMQEGILPGYHMNHDHWISVLLDGTVPVEEIYPLIDISFRLTQSGKARKKS